MEYPVAPDTSWKVRHTVPLLSVKRSVLVLPRLGEEPIEDVLSELVRQAILIVESEECGVVALRPLAVGIERRILLSNEPTPGPLIPFILREFHWS